MRPREHTRGVMSLILRRRVDGLPFLNGGGGGGLLLGGSWYLLTNYNCTYNPTKNTPKGPYRVIPIVSRVISPVISG